VGYKILFTEDALVDLEIILDYIRADNPIAAERFGAALLNHVELLQTFPRIGFQCSGNRVSANFCIRPSASTTAFRTLRG
jgi:plasmid stabilization system protein ParE